MGKLITEHHNFWTTLIWILAPSFKDFFLQRMIKLWHWYTSVARVVSATQWQSDLGRFWLTSWTSAHLNRRLLNDYYTTTRIKTPILFLLFCQNNKHERNIFIRNREKMWELGFPSQSKYVKDRKCTEMNRTESTQSPNPRKVSEGEKALL